MALTDWMVQFDTLTSEWLTRLEAEKDHDRYYALFNEQPSVSKYTQNTKYQSNLDILEKYLEDAIAKDAWYAYFYARDVLKGPFPLGEEAISKDPDYAHYYARHVLKSPFPAGEETIAEANATWRKDMRASCS